MFVEVYSNNYPLRRVRIVVNRDELCLFYANYSSGNNCATSILLSFTYFCLCLHFTHSKYLAFKVTAICYNQFKLVSVLVYLFLLYKLFAFNENFWSAHVLASVNLRLQYRVFKLLLTASSYLRVHFSV